MTKSIRHDHYPTTTKGNSMSATIETFPNATGYGSSDAHDVAIIAIQRWEAEGGALGMLQRQPRPSDI